MTLEITTPAILFSAISLMMAAYMVRFSKLYQVSSDLAQHLNNKEKTEQKMIKEQLFFLTKRIKYIKWLQSCAIFSLLASTVSIFLLLGRQLVLAKLTFGMAIMFFLFCLILVLAEIYYSVKALDINLRM